MKFLKFFEEIDREDFIWLTIAFVIIVTPGYSIGFYMDFAWMIIVSSIIVGCYLFTSFMAFYADFVAKKKDSAILQELPSFPQQDFCDSCGKPLVGGEQKTDGEFLIITCPFCKAENILGDEKKVQELKENIEEENDEN